MSCSVKVFLFFYIMLECIYCVFHKNRSFIIWSYDKHCFVVKSKQIAGLDYFCSFSELVDALIELLTFHTNELFFTSLLYSHFVYTVYSSIMLWLWECQVIPLCRLRCIHSIRYSFITLLYIQSTWFVSNFTIWHCMSSFTEHLLIHFQLNLAREQNPYKNIHLLNFPLLFILLKSISTELF